MRKKENLISIILILIYIIVVLTSDIVIAKFIGGTNRDICNFEFDFKLIVIHSFIGIFKILDKIILAIWISWHAKKYFSNSWFYAMIGLLFGLIGLAFYISELLVAKRTSMKLELNKFAVLLIVIFIIGVISTFIYNFVEYEIFQRLFGNTVVACLIENKSENHRLLSAITIFIRFLAYIFIVIKFSNLLGELKVKKGLWIISTLLIGIIPWTIFNMLKVIKNE